MNENVPPLPAQMLRIITGYWVSQAVGTLAELGIADELTGGPKSAADLAKRAGTDERATFRLLRACASVGILAQDEDDGFSLTPLGATLRSDVPGSMRGMAIAQTAPGHWLPWGKLRDAVRTGTRQTLATLGTEIFAYYRSHEIEARAFMGAMGNLSALVAMELARVVDLRGASIVVDVGGADGTLTAALLHANSLLRGIVLELPHVVAGARDALAKKGLGGRCDVVSGDFFAAVPPGGDIYLLKQILHDWDDEQSVAILRNCAAVMKPTGRVLIVEMVIPDDRGSTAAQLMDLNMLVMLTGRERTAAEYRDLLARAGLKPRQILETQSPFQVIEATTSTSSL